MYTLILITVLWTSNDGRSTGTTTTVIQTAMNAGECNATAKQTNRSVDLTNGRTIALFATCVKGSK